jgi:RNA recognition motif-containing protein
MKEESVGLLVGLKSSPGWLCLILNRRRSQYLFASAGTVESAAVVEDRDTGHSRGFAFVEMSSDEEATSAIELFNGKEVSGRALKVNEAQPRENRSHRGREQRR